MEQQLKSSLSMFGPGAEVRLTKAQSISLATLVALFVITGIVLQLTLLEYLQAFVAICTAFFAIMFCFSFYAAANGMREGSLLYVSMEEVQELLKDSDAVKGLPFVTIIVAAYKEAAVIEQLIESLRLLKYPLRKYEVLVVLEENDDSTIEAFEVHLPQNWKVVIRPTGGIKTKPAAMNYLLENGYVNRSSEITVVFDAEDQPAQYQLVEAVIAFRKAWKQDKMVACIQARLEFSQNKDSANWLQKMLNIDYLHHFGLVLPGLSRLGFISPLGGTSNYILTKVLLSLGGWDARNVTEDLNLAVILARLGYQTRVLNSVTAEEAVSSMKSFVFQRSRWIKGGIQTYFRHMRNPLQLWKDLGFVRFVSFQLIIGAPLVLYLINPLFWGMTFTYLVTQSPLIQALYPPLMFYAAMLCFTAGNFMYIYLLLTASFRTKHYGMLVYGFCAPLYWFLLSLAGYKAVFEFVLSSEGAQKWEKTEHRGAKAA